MVECFFRDLTVNRLRRGVFRDVMELVTAIDDYVDHHNEHPKPFIWTAFATDILEKVKRARKALVGSMCWRARSSLAELIEMRYFGGITAEEIVT
jgi:hypothetical protein